MDEVYDVVNDPYELKNLVKDAELTAKLDKELSELIKDVRYTIPKDANKGQPMNPEKQPMKKGKAKQAE